MSWWFLANHVGSRFRAEAERLLGPETELGEGLWQYPALGRKLLVVSRDNLPIDRESVPLHLVTVEPLERALALAREVAQQPGFWKTYGAWLAQLHARVVEEARQMARALGNELELDLRPLIEMVGIKQVIDQMGPKQVIEQMGAKQVIDTIGRNSMSKLCQTRGALQALTRGAARP